MPMAKPADVVPFAARILSETIIKLAIVSTPSFRTYLAI